MCKCKSLSFVPNFISLSRIFLTAAFVFYIFKEKIDAAFIVFVVAAITDFLDGRVARYFKATWIDWNYSPSLERNCNFQRFRYFISCMFMQILINSFGIQASFFQQNKYNNTINIRNNNFSLLEFLNRCTINNIIWLRTCGRSINYFFRRGIRTKLLLDKKCNMHT